MVASARTTQKVLTEFNVDERPPIIYEPLYGEFAMKGTNGANGPAKSLTHGSVGHWLKYDPSAATQSVQEMQNLLNSPVE
jgi:hypothetical protein